MSKISQDELIEIIQNLRSMIFSVAQNDCVMKFDAKHCCKIKQVGGKTPCIHFQLCKSDSEIETILSKHQ
jgi:hypothetical protein